MIKFKAGNAENGVLFGFGLSAENIKRMREGLPIHVYLREMGAESNDSIVILAGETEADIERELAQFIGPETIITRGNTRQ